MGFLTGITAIIFTLLFGAVAFSTNTEKALAATTTGRTPITCYLTGNSRVNTYKSVRGAYSGYIDAVDKCKILNVYSSGWVRVRYPISGGRYKTAYTYSKYFFTNVNFSTATKTAGKNLTVYRKSNLSQTLGTVYGSDSIFEIGSQNGNTQILYPISGGYKMGFIKGSLNTGNYAPVTYNASASEIEKLCFDYKYYANRYADLKAAFGYDEKALYNHWKNYGIREGRSASPILDISYYLNQNADLKAAFGSDNTAAYNHFLKWGYGEYRNSSEYYNGDYYRRNYTDLQSYDSKFLLEHYLKYGINEKRYANTKRYTGEITVNTSSANQSVAQQMVQYELSQVGVGDYKGNNNVIYNTWFYNRTIKGSGYPWCMAFQAYCCYQVTGSNSAIPKKASCTATVNEFKERGQFHYSKYYGGNYTPKAGDLVFYTSNKGSNSCHVGMITAAPVNGYLQTVEGNIKCSDGNWKVVRFTKNAKRTINNSYV